MKTTKLNKWGNSQGVLIPKQVCESVGLAVGDRVAFSADSASGKIEITLVTESQKPK